MLKRVLIAVAVVALIVDCTLVSIKLHKKEKIKKAIAVEHNKKDYKYSVFITSDDGPLRGSKNLDAIIRDYQVPVTLFCIGKALYQDPAHLRANFKRYKHNPYVIIGNHSFTHANLHYKRFYKNPQGVEQDFLKNEKFLHITTKLARFPGRNVWALGDEYKGEPHALQAAKLLHENDGYKVFGWDYELKHNRKGTILKDAYLHYNNIKKLLKEGKTFRPKEIVVLMHDQMYTDEISKEELGELIMLLQYDSEVKLKLLNKYKI